MRALYDPLLFCSVCAINPRAESTENRLALGVFVLRLSLPWFQWSPSTMNASFSGDITRLTMWLEVKQATRSWSVCI